MAAAFQLSNITLSSTNNSIPTPLFGLQDVLVKTNFDSITTDAPHRSLFPFACGQGNGPRNCTAACSDNGTMFSSLDTLHNCVVWPSIVVESAKDGLSPSSIPLVSSLGFGNGSSQPSLPSQISNNIQECLIKSCENDGVCKLKANKTHQPGGFRKQFSHNLTGDEYYNSNKSLVYFNPCQYVSAPAIADVAGIGVLKIDFWIREGC